MILYELFYYSSPTTTSIPSSQLLSSYVSSKTILEPIDHKQRSMLKCIYFKSISFYILYLTEQSTALMSCRYQHILQDKLIFLYSVGPSLSVFHLSLIFLFFSSTISSIAHFKNKFWVNDFPTI